MKICLVRHGETDANKNRIMQGQTQNLQLNQNGIMQATELKNKIEDIHFDACFTSPLLRAWSTAIILVGDRVEIKEDNRLIERYLGELEGLDRSNYDVSLYWDYKLNSNSRDVEPIQDIFKRCKSFLDDIKNRYSDDATILVVSHGAITRCLHHLLLDSDITKNLVDFSVGNCYYKEYEIEEKK